jgi:hypothetical protein
MAEIIDLNQRRELKERIQVAKRLGLMQTTEVWDDAHIFHQSDSAAEKLVKLALNTVKANKELHEITTLGEGYTDGMDE